MSGPAPDTGRADTGPTDDQLILRAGTGDEAALAAFIARHRNTALAVAARYCNATEDVLQDATLSIWRGARQFDPSKGPARAWFLQTVRNRAIDLIRREARHQRSGDDDDSLIARLRDPDPDPGERTVLRERADRARRALSFLPSEQRRVIELAYFGGLSHSQIAEQVDAPVGTIKGRQRLALKKMRKQLEPALA